MNLTRVRLFLSLTGMVVAVLAVMRNDRRLVWSAIALLAASLILRLVQRRRGRGDRQGGL
jgi:hypothetical protein